MSPRRDPTMWRPPLTHPCGRCGCPFEVRKRLRRIRYCADCKRIRANEDRREKRLLLARINRTVGVP